MCTGQSHYGTPSPQHVGLALAAQSGVVTVDQREAMIREFPFIAQGMKVPGMPRTMTQLPPKEQMRISRLHSRSGAHRSSSKSSEDAEKNVHDEDESRAYRL